MNTKFGFASCSISNRLDLERIKRNSDAFWQCKCEIGLPFLKPVGQQLRWISGREQTRIQMLPVDLMEERSVKSYETYNGDCWWCCHSFSWNAVGCPSAMKNLKKFLDPPIVHKRRKICTKENLGVGANCTNCKKKHNHRHVKKNVQRLKGDPSKEPIEYIEKIARPSVFYEETFQRTETVAGYVFVGYFCGWSCARAYGELHFPGLRSKIGSWILRFLIETVKILKKQDQSDREQNIPPRNDVPLQYKPVCVHAAPHFALLKKFGGSMSIQEFREIEQKDNDHFLRILDPIRRIVPSEMLAVEIPERSSFRRRYNDQMALKAMNKKKRSQKRIVKKKRARTNAILSCIKKKKH